MRLVPLALYLFLNVFFASAEQDVGLEKPSNETVVDESQFVDFDVIYNILERPNYDLSKGVDFSIEEIVTFNYSFTNNEDTNVSVVGVSGTVIANPEGYQVANITEQSIGPVSITPNETAKFQAGVKLVLPEGSFYMLPVLAVLKNAKIMKVGIRPLLINVNPPPMSFFNPSFLSIQILLGSFIAGVSYILFTLNKADAKKKTVKNAKPISVDQSWLPDTYKNPGKLAK